MNNIVSIPTPSSISYLWNFGSLLGSFLFVQLATGLTLSFYYSPFVSESFSSIVSLSEDIPCGWLLRSAHANGASFFFISMYAHIGRGLLYKSFNNTLTWVSGVTIFLASMSTAFLGYVLPWGQMSFWGATVITNLLSALPNGEQVVLWVWGGFSVGGPTLSRFFSIHFILPFVIFSLVLVHLFFLHENGSQNPLGVPLSSDKIFFHPFFSVNDLLGILAIGFLFVSITVCVPDLFMDPDNFSPANSMSTPLHIQPEWYFLFAYAILRSIPNNIGGVLALLSAVLVLYLLPFISSNWENTQFSSIVFWLLVGNFLLLTWVGSIPAEGSLISLGNALSISYFTLILLIAA